MTIAFSLAVLLLCGLTLNILRYWVPDRWADLVIIAGTIAAIEADVWLHGSELLPYVMVLFAAVASCRYTLAGPLGAAAAGFILLSLQTELPGEALVLLPALYGAVGMVVSVYARRNYHENQNRERFEYQQYRQSKQLNIIREVSNAFQSTLEYEQLQHVILTIVTSGYGLGFNRAMLFLATDDGEHLEGKRALGVLSAEEGIQNWIRIVSSNLRMKDFLNLRHESKENDKPLLDLVSEIRLPISDAGFLTKALNKGKPLLYPRLELSDPVMRMFDERFHMKEFAAIPLITNSKPIGVLVVDNNINFEPISYDDLDAVIPIADQAASAISNVRAYSQTQEQAITDGLTGMYNQRFFQEMLVSSLRSHAEMALLVLDIDHFKHYNDTNGHLAGNEALAQVSCVMKDSIRSQDIAFRFGGEEFVVILPNTTIADAAIVGERIRLNIERSSFLNQHLQPSGNLTVSIGIAGYPKHRQHPEKLLEAADQAMYDAKRSGKNKVVLYAGG